MDIALLATTINYTIVKIWTWISKMIPQKKLSWNYSFIKWRQVLSSYNSVQTRLFVGDYIPQNTMSIITQSIYWNLMVKSGYLLRVFIDFVIVKNAMVYAYSAIRCTYLNVRMKTFQCFVPFSTAVTVCLKLHWSNASGEVINALLIIDAIWREIFGLTLVKMCCLTAPGHYLN